MINRLIIPDQDLIDRILRHYDREDIVTQMDLDPEEILLRFWEEAQETFTTDLDWKDEKEDD